MYLVLYCGRFYVQIVAVIEKLASNNCFSIPAFGKYLELNPLARLFGHNVLTYRKIWLTFSIAKFLLLKWNYRLVLKNLDNEPFVLGILIFVSKYCT